MKLTGFLAAALVSILAVFVPGPADAHFIWIETDPRGAPGKSQDVHVYFGEPHEFLREESGGRLDQHDALRAWVVDPKGEKTPLTLKKGLNRFSGTVTPRRVGRHNVIVTSDGHEVMDLTQYDRGLTKPLFYARAQFLAFEKGRLSEREDEIKELLDYDIVPVSKGLDPLTGSIVATPGSEVALRLVSKGQPVARKRLHVFGPNGWVKELQPTDSWGVTTFVPLWGGRYVVVFEKEEKTAGDFGGKRYEAVSQRASFSLLVEKSD